MIVSCDPGLYGAFCLYEGPQLAPRAGLSVYDMPTYKRLVAGQRSERLILDEEGIIRLLDEFRLFGADTLYLEKVNGAPGQSAPAAFSFGYGVGIVVAAARIGGYRIERTEPSIWKRALRVPADKRAARDRAGELLPAHKHLWPLAKHDGRAEAAMLALYGWQERRD